MSKFSTFLSSIPSRIHSSFTKLKSYKSILVKPKECVINAIILRNGNLIAFIGNYSDYKYESYLYEYENNYSSRQKIELNLDTHDLRNNGIWSSFEFDNGDLVICYSSDIDIRKTENNKFSKIKRIFYSGRVSDMRVKKLDNNRFIVGRQFSITIQLWAKKEDDNNYECIFEKSLPTDMYYSQFINKNLFNIQIDNKIWFYKHDFNDNNNKIKILRYKSKEIQREI